MEKTARYYLADETREPKNYHTIQKKLYNQLKEMEGYTTWKHECDALCCEVVAKKAERRKAKLSND